MANNRNWACPKCRISRRSEKATFPRCGSCGGEMMQVSRIPPKSDDKAWKAMGRVKPKPKGTVAQARAWRGGTFDKYFS